MLTYTLAPEIVSGIAFQEMIDAISCQNTFRAAGYSLDRRFAFYVQMGGICLKDSTSLQVYTVDWRQLHCLVKERIISLPETTMKGIEDKSKPSILIKVFACLQATWFAVRCISRSASGLPITELEVSTLGYIASTIITYSCWWYKPLDNVDRHFIAFDGEHDEASNERQNKSAGVNVHDEIISSPVRSRMQTIIPIQLSLATIRTRLASSRLPTLSRSRVPNMDLEIEVPIHISQLKKEVRDKLHRFGSVFLVGSMFTLLVGVVFGAVHVVAWNFSFPTRAEQILWRVCSLIITSVHPIMFMSWILTSALEPLLTPNKAWSWLRHSRSLTDDSSQTKHEIPPSGDLGQRPHRLVRFLIDMHERNCAQVMEDITVTEWYLLGVHEVIFGTCAMVYGVARIILFVEMFASFRSMPAEIYQTLSWFQYVPLI